MRPSARRERIVGVKRVGGIETGAGRRRDENAPPASARPDRALIAGYRHTDLVRTDQNPIAGLRAADARPRSRRFFDELRNTPFRLLSSM